MEILQQKKSKDEAIDEIVEELVKAVTDYGYNDEYGYYNDWADGVRPIIGRAVYKIEELLKQ